VKIALFLPNWIGDAVMATPAIRAVREHFPGAEVIGVVKPYVAGLFEGSPWLDRLIYLDARGPWSRLGPAAARQLRREKIDLAILFPNSFHSALVAWLGGCRRRIGYRRYCRGWLLTDPLEPVRDDRGRLQPSPIIDAYNCLARTAGCPPPGHRMELFTTPRDEAGADAVWQQTGLSEAGRVVCLNPGAAFGAAKHWPIPYFIELAQNLADHCRSGVLVMCGPAERDLARQISSQARRPLVHSLADQPLSLGLTRACLRRCSLLITTDSGPRHIAAAFDRPVLTLFGPTHIAWTETYHLRSVHLQKPVPCGPCQLRVCPLDHRCMTELRPEEVFAAARRLLERFPLSAADFPRGLAISGESSC
jgi:heptosyltransferase-2